MSEAYSLRFDAAVALAVAAFRGKVRKDTTIPYVTHLFAVTAIVGEYGGDEDQMIAAVLHDYLEDIKGADANLIEQRFGTRVRRLVESLTDATTHPKPAWRPRKEAYVAHLAHEPAELKLISAADKLHNCSAIRRDLARLGPVLFDRFTGKREGTLWYYRSVAEALRNGWDHPLGTAITNEVRALHADAGEALPAAWGYPEPAGGPATEVSMCKTGVERHGPDLRERLAGVGGRLDLVDCFDKCEQCENYVLAKIDGAFFKCRLAQELVDAVETIRSAES